MLTTIVNLRISANRTHIGQSCKQIKQPILTAIDFLNPRSVKIQIQSCKTHGLRDRGFKRGRIMQAENGNVDQMCNHPCKTTMPMTPNNQTLAAAPAPETASPTSSPRALALASTTLSPLNPLTMLAWP